MPVFLPALLLPVLFLAGCNRNRSAEYRAAGEREPAAVRVEAVRAVDNVYSDTYIGTVRASRSAVISCRSKFAECHKHEGHGPCHACTGKGWL